MQSQNKIAYLVSLTLFFSYVEMLLPRFTPFFRLGLANIVILNSFSMPLSAFTVLLLTKAVAASMMSGTLFTPFLLISVCQSLASGFLMYFLNYATSKKRLLSLYGISCAGSSLSAVVQLALCGLYLGSGTKVFIAPMLVFNVFSGFLTAFLSGLIQIPKHAPELLHSAEGRAPALSRALRCPLSPLLGLHPKTRPAKIVAASVLLLCAGSIFFINKTVILTAAFLMALVLQALSGRKILILPHACMWIFILVSQFLIPEGQVLYEFSGFTITEGALITGLQKALKLSAVSALSQCAAGIKAPEDTVIGKSLLYYKALSDELRNSKGSILFKVRTALSAEKLYV